LKIRNIKPPSFALLLIIVHATLYFIVSMLSDDIMKSSYGSLPAIAYFTVQTNIFVLVWYIYLMLKKRFKKLPDVDSGLALALTIYITITGIVYWFVLVPIYGFTPNMFSLRNIWLHIVTPIFSIWVFFTMTRKEPIDQNQIALTLIYPLLYLAMAFYFNTYFGSFPYPFLDSEVMGGVLPVIFAIILMLLLFLFVGALYAKLYNKMFTKDSSVLSSLA